VSPSLWYDDHFTFRLLAKRKTDIQGLSARAFFAIGSKENGGKDRQMVTDLEVFLKKLRSEHPENLSSDLWIGEDETHHGIFPGAAMRGLRWAYSWHYSLPPKRE